MALKWKRYAWPELSRRQFGICHNVILGWRRAGYSSLAIVAVKNILTAVLVCSTAAIICLIASFVCSTAAFVCLTALLVSAISSDKRSSFLSNRSWFSTTVSRPASILFSLASINVSRVEVATLDLAFPKTVLVGTHKDVFDRHTMVLPSKKHTYTWRGLLAVLFLCPLLCLLQFFFQLVQLRFQLMDCSQRLLVTVWEWE